jgi:hypothetical protein
MKKWLSFVIVFQLLTLNLAFAQQDDVLANTQDDILMVAAAGAGGAVLGLSTLSFVNEPSKSISNIWTGAALGIIVGVIYVAYNSAQKNSADLISHSPEKDFSTASRGEWHLSKVSSNLTVTPSFFNPIWQTRF